MDRFTSKLETSSVVRLSQLEYYRTPLILQDPKIKQIKIIPILINLADTVGLDQAGIMAIPEIEVQMFPFKGNPSVFCQSGIVPTPDDVTDVAPNPSGYPYYSHQRISIRKMSPKNDATVDDLIGPEQHINHFNFHAPDNIRYISNVLNVSHQSLNGAFRVDSEAFVTGFYIESWWNPATSNIEYIPMSLSFQFIDLITLSRSIQNNVIASQARLGTIMQIEGIEGRPWDAGTANINNHIPYIPFKGHSLVCSKNVGDSIQLITIDNGAVYQSGPDDLYFFAANDIQDRSFVNVNIFNKIIVRPNS